MQRHTWFSRESWLPAFGLALGLGLFGWTLGRLDVRGALSLASRCGPAMALALVPYGAAIAMDCVGWSTILRGLGYPVRWLRLAPVRLGIEALHTSLPGGALVADGLNPVLLARAGSLPMHDAVASVVARKGLIWQAHGAYLMAGSVVGWAVLERLAPSLGGIPGLPFWVMASAVVPLGLAITLWLTTTSGHAAAWAQRRLASSPWPGLATWVSSRRSSFAATDASFERLRTRGRRPLAWAGAVYLSTWLLESVETLLLLRLLGAPVSFAEAMAVEAGLSLLRSAAVFAPGGIGVQDLGYVVFLRLLGVGDPELVSGAFVLLKRAKEVVWILVGYACLAGLGVAPRLGRSPRASAPAEAQPAPGAATESVAA